jgi:hypothetical protein
MCMCTLYGLWSSIEKVTELSPALHSEIEQTIGVDTCPKDSNSQLV